MPKLSSANLNYLNSIVTLPKETKAEIKKETTVVEKQENGKRSVVDFANKNGTIILNLAILGASVVAFSQASKINKAAQEALNQSQGFIKEAQAAINSSKDEILKLTSNARDEIEKFVESAKDQLDKINDSVEQIVQKANELTSKTPEISKDLEAGIKSMVTNAINEAIQQNKIDVSKIEDNIVQILQKSLDSNSAAIQKASQAQALAMESKMQDILKSAFDKIEEQIKQVVVQNISKASEDEASKTIKLLQEINTAKISSDILGLVQKGVQEMTSSASVAMNEKQMRQIEIAINETIAKTLGTYCNQLISSTQSKLENISQNNISKVQELIQRTIQQSQKTFKLSDITFEKGKAYIANDEKFTGVIEDFVVKKGVKLPLKMTYLDGQILSSEIGDIIKIYSSKINNGIVENIVQLTKKDSDLSVISSSWKPVVPMQKGSPRGSKRVLLDNTNKIKRTVCEVGVLNGNIEKIEAQDGAYAKLQSGFPSENLEDEILEYNNEMFWKSSMGEDGLIRHTKEVEPSIVSEVIFDKDNIPLNLPLSYKKGTVISDGKKRSINYDTHPCKMRQTPKGFLQDTVYSAISKEPDENGFRNIINKKGTIEFGFESQNIEKAFEAPRMYGRRLNEVIFDKGKAYVYGEDGKTPIALNGFIEDIKGDRHITLFYENGEIKSSIVEIGDSVIKKDYSKIVNEAKGATTNMVKIDNGTHVKLIHQSTTSNGQASKQRHIVRCIEDGKNNSFRREISHMQIADGKFTRLEAQDGPYASIKGINDITKENADKISQYNSENFGEEKIQDETLKGEKFAIIKNLLTKITKGNISKNGKKTTSDVKVCSYDNLLSLSSKTNRRILSFNSKQK